MRPSEFEAIRSNLQRAVDAINASFEQERQSRENAKEFEEEFERRAALPQGTAPQTELKRPSRKQYEQDVRAMLGPPPRRKEAMEQYRIRESLMLHPRITRPPIESAYPWRHPVKQAAEDLARCGWTTEAGAIAEVLNGLPTGATDWEQPGGRDRQLDAIRAGAERIMKILTTCLGEQPPADKPAWSEYHTPEEWRRAWECSASAWRKNRDAMRRERHPVSGDRKVRFALTDLVRLGLAQP